MPPTEQEMRKEKEKRLKESLYSESEPRKKKSTFVGDVKVERNKLTGKLMRAELKGDKKKIADIQVKRL